MADPCASILRPRRCACLPPASFERPVSDRHAQNFTATMASMAVLCATLERPRQTFGLLCAFNGDLASFVDGHGRYKGRSPCLKGVFAITWISADLLLIGPFWTNLIEVGNKMKKNRGLGELTDPYDQGFYVGSLKKTKRKTFSTSSSFKTCIAVRWWPSNNILNKYWCWYSDPLLMTRSYLETKQTYRLSQELALWHHGSSRFSVFVYLFKLGSTLTVVRSSIPT